MLLPEPTDQNITIVELSKICVVSLLHQCLWSTGEAIRGKFVHSELSHIELESI